jgi:hypothetical protein
VALQFDFGMQLSDEDMNDMIKAIDKDNDGQVGIRAEQRDALSHIRMHAPVHTRYPLYQLGARCQA